MSHDLKLTGCFALRAADGREVQIGSRRARIILAYTATSRDFECSRTRLGALLWPDKKLEQVGASLRKELCGLRVALGPLRPPIVAIDRDRVRLLRENLRIDVFDAAAPDWSRFMDGLDLADVEPVEDWLRERRAEPAPAAPPRPPARAASPLSLDRAPTAAAADAMRVAFEPSAVAANDAVAASVGAALVDRMMRRLAELGPFEVYAWPTAAEDAGDPPDVRVNCSVLHASGDVHVGLCAVEFASGRLIWTSGRRATVASFARSALTVVHLSDELIDRLQRHAPTLFGRRQTAAALALRGIDQLLRVPYANLAAAQASLEAAAAADGRGEYWAWLGYVGAFRHESGAEGGGDRAPFDEYAARARERAGDSPLVAALIAHVHAFVRRDFAAARDLLEPFDEFGADNLLLQDARALLCLYTGSVPEAARRAQAVARIGARNPYRYLFATTEALTALTAGRYADAARFGGRALAQINAAGPQAVFAPALRTVIAACGHLGDAEGARLAVSRMLAYDPDFVADGVERLARVPIPNPATFEATSLGMRKAIALAAQG
ncbi:AfsR/SARP family transcriptional regulator [Rubrimonas cliftonensis]|uniref:TolB amino-terminal domain-containing protein n=1 Tax=Rubrimonas cliftonensis TaxID=89524 RepID=A0A1H4EKT9_9RHOB|nr:hypothetical protein [Rubrimonas cliftonensis]SEA85704.1 hypothetical protein SAMN05444370_11485 [Rubrimonas cliftonensis]